MSLRPREQCDAIMCAFGMDTDRARPGELVFVCLVTMFVNDVLFDFYFLSDRGSGTCA